MNLSPMLREQYLAAARELVNCPLLPQLSSVFQTLVTDPAVPMKARPVETTVGEATGDSPVWQAAKEFTPNLNLPFQAKLGDIVTLDYQFRFSMQSAAALGSGGVWDASARSLVVKAGNPVRVKFGPSNSKSLVITPEESLWVGGFSTTGETSGESLFTNHEKMRKVITLSLDLEGGVKGEGINELAVCALSRDQESGAVVLTATMSGAGTATLTHDLIEGEGRGNTFYAFRAPKGERIVRLKLDGSQFSGNHVLFDDLAFLTDTSGAAAASQVHDFKTGMSDENKRLVARNRLVDFLPRVFRHPVDQETIDRYLGVFDESRKRGAAFDVPMKDTIAAALTSPDFLYVSEIGAGDGNVRPLTDHELATRLSYFLWAAPPDELLLASAAAENSATRPHSKSRRCGCSGTLARANSVSHSQANGCGSTSS
jgi:hypothetical protein